MLPEGWKRCPLSEVAHVTSGGTPNRAEPSYWGGNIPWVTTGEIRFNTIISTAEKITDVGLKNSSAKLLSSGTLLMAMYGQEKTRGQVAKLGIDASTNQACAAITLKPGYDSDFFFHALSWKYEAIRELGNEGTQKNLSGGIIKEIEVAVPATTEQQDIARILAIWDEAISTTDRLLTVVRKQKMSLLSKMLRVPAEVAEISDRNRTGSVPPSVRAGIPRLPSTPAGWCRAGLSTYLREVHRPVVLEPEREYTLVTVRRSRGGVQERAVLRGIEVKTPSQFIVKAGDFLISKRQIVHGACGIVPPELDGAVVSNEYAVLNSNGKIDLEFLRYLSESIYFQQTCFHSSIGVHVEKMIFKTERWLTWPFNIPPLPEQRQIVEVLDGATAEVMGIERQLAAFKLEKKALMQQLLTGKRRVHLPEPATAVSI